MGNLWNCIILDTKVKDGKKVCAIKNKEGNITYFDDILEESLDDFVKDIEAKAKKEGKTANEYLDELAELRNRTKPSKSKNPFAKPSGRVTKISPNLEEYNKISLELENEAAEILAKEGYDIEQNPVVRETLKNPDYKIEGNIFDCYSPSEDKAVRGVWTEIAKKVEKGQTKKIVLQLKIWKGDLTKLQQQFSDWPIEGLEEVIYITKNNKIDHLKLTK
ncbi:hypothetical protein J3D55_000631 [Chryseobacterium ginsenosidimutans]|jgi:hypothetical protein|uniref:CdiA C-terminal domain-containing protein n=1 Tax=Chryseobacterium ginsenosidimutans TaxID=687846 RepID=UPI00216A29F1|nr:hypothetical protein [Chryseobacterium ginsenosidimutans]MCS3867715.1 hypothetical protein [Chryseobacterium ginsenosidimutans]